MIDFKEVIEHPVIQGSEEWHNLRTGRITGSNFPLLMKKPRGKGVEWSEGQLTYLRKVAAEILTGVSDESDYKNAAMEWGTVQEDSARIEYSDIIMKTIRSAGFFEYSDLIGDSPDGIIGDTGVIEIKCPTSQVHLLNWLDNEQFFEKHKWQLYGHMLCSGRSNGALISYDQRMPDDRRMVVVKPPEGYLDDVNKLEERINKAAELIKEWIL